jgi:translation elongation factor EF-Tu-like GTPase
VSQHGGFFLKKEEGGRHTPFHNKYRPQISSRLLESIQDESKGFSSLIR